MSTTKENNNLTDEGSFIYLEANYSFLQKVKQNKIASANRPDMSLSKGCRTMTNLTGFSETRNLLRAGKDMWGAKSLAI